MEMGLVDVMAGLKQTPQKRTRKAGTSDRGKITFENLSSTPEANGSDFSLTGTLNPVNLHTPQPLRSYAGYLEIVLNEPQEIRKRAQILQRKGVQFDTIVGTGLSGTLPMMTLRQKFKCEQLIIRKPGANSHSYYKAEGTLGSRWLFIDDFISSGKTFVDVFCAVRYMEIQHGRIRDEYAQCAGIFLYNEYLPKNRFVSFDELMGPGRPLLYAGPRKELEEILKA
jgi:hypothetical protein